MVGLEKYFVAKMRMREETFFGPFRPLGHDDQKKFLSKQILFLVKFLSVSRLSKKKSGTGFSAPKHKPIEQPNCFEGPAAITA